MDLSKYDFVDFGCSTGDSIRMGTRLFGGRGIGLDRSPEKVAQARAAGYDAEEVDLAKLDTAKIGRTGFALMIHFLEHLRSFSIAKQCIDSACKVARDFVLIEQPYFDADPYLFGNGLKLYWSDWSGHTLPMTSLQLYRCISPLLGNGARRAMIGFQHRLANSAAVEVHSIRSAEDQHGFDSHKHPRKRKIEFQFPVYKETCAVILTGLEELTEPLAKFVRELDVVWDSAENEKR